MSNIKDTADAVKGIVEAVPVYEDMLQPATRELSKGFLTVAKTVNIALAPLSGLVWGYEKISQFLDTSIAKKLEDVPEEKIITPDPSVAGPAIEALRFSAHNEDIREMFSSLLATAMNSDVAEQAHPSFVEIIKQLSPDEAKIISAIQSVGYLPLIGVKTTEVNDTSGYREIKRNFSNLPFILGCSYPGMSSSYIDNLARLGLIEIDNLLSMVDEKRYDALIYHPFIQELVSSVDLTKSTVDYSKYVFSRTEFGKKFADACTTS